MDTRTGPPCTELPEQLQKEQLTTKGRGQGGNQHFLSTYYVQAPDYGGSPTLLTVLGHIYIPYGFFL